MPPDLKYRVLNAITQYSLLTPENVCTLNIKKDNILFCFCLFFFCYSDSDIFSVIMLKNVVRNAARSQKACSQCYNSLFTFTLRKYDFNLNIKIQIIFCFSSFGK